MGRTNEECWVCDKVGIYDHDNDEDGNMTLLAEGYVHWDCFDKAQEIREQEEKQRDYCPIGMSHCVCCGWRGKYPVSGCPNCHNSFVE